MHSMNKDINHSSGSHQEPAVEIKFSEEKLKEVAEIVARYPEGKQKSALIPVLHLAQQEFGGWLSTATMDYVASVLDLKPIEVYEVVSFYTMFHTKPVGKNVFYVCRTGPCMLKGSDQLIAYIGEKLGIAPGETTADGMFTLLDVECIGACGYAPVMQLGKTYREFLTPEKVDQIVEECMQNAEKNN